MVLIMGENNLQKNNLLSVKYINIHYWVRRYFIINVGYTL